MTIINHTYRFAFVHIPKNAGTSVALALAPLTSYRDLELGATELGQVLAPQFRKRFGIGKHATLPEIMALIGPSESHAYRTFCVTRDPFDRVVSMFTFLQRWTDWRRLPAYEAFVPEFLDCGTLDEFVRSSFFASRGPDRLFVPQVEWIRGPGGVGVGVDRVIAIADLEDGLRSFLADIGVPDPVIRDLSVSVANDSPSDVTPRDLSPRAIDMILERYAEDFEALGYPTAPSVSRS